MNELRVTKAPLLDADLSVPGDKSISHRAAMLAALSDGTCVLRNYLRGEDCIDTLRVLRQLGAEIEERGDDYVVRGTSGWLKPPKGDLYCGNSGTTMRLMAGILAGQPFRVRLTGDASLSRRPMDRIVEPLSRMGARLKSEGDRSCPPLVVEGNPELEGAEYTLPVASAQVKSAVLLAGLFARGTTTVIEPVITRDHTERMLIHFGIPVRHKGNRISVDGGSLPSKRDFTIPGDISSAAFWLVAAAAQNGSRLAIRDVGLNPSRTGVLSVLERMGARLARGGESTEAGEPRGTVQVSGQGLVGATIAGAEIPNVIDELPVLAVAGALARGTTTIRDAGELRVKESDRLAVVAHHLLEMGADVTELADGLEIRGGRPLRGARLASHGDHRIAMAFAVAGLFAEGETVITDTDCVETSYPGFSRQLEGICRG